MGGFFNIFKNAKRAADGKAQEVADNIEAENMVTFGKQDIDKMETELRKVNENVGTLKGEMAVNEDKIKGIKSEIKKHENDAASLATEHEDLALKHCEAAERLEGQVEPLQMAYDVQKQTLEEQVSARNELKSALMQAESDLVTLKAMDDAAKANENLASVNTESGKSAVAAFAEKKDMAKKRLIKSRVLKEADKDPDSDLAKATQAALGTGGAKARLDALKAKTKKKK